MALAFCKKNAFYFPKSVVETLAKWCYSVLVSLMAQILQIIQIVSSILIVALVLLQRSNSSDMGSSLGSDGGSFLQTRRGAERFIFVLTILVAIVFAGASLTAVVLFK